MSCRFLHWSGQIALKRKINWDWLACPDGHNLLLDLNNQNKQQDGEQAAKLIYILFGVID